MENNRKGCINRDKNGCKNIQKVFKHIWKQDKHPKSIEENTNSNKID